MKRNCRREFIGWKSLSKLWMGLQPCPLWYAEQSVPWQQAMARWYEVQQLMGRVQRVFCFADIITHISATQACSCSSSFSSLFSFLLRIGIKWQSFFQKGYNETSYLDSLWRCDIFDQITLYWNNIPWEANLMRRGKSFIRPAETDGKKQVVFQACSAFSKFNRGRNSKRRVGNEITFSVTF